ncbi:hypothetical protein MUP77_08705 [Candidatus Bathyarchaeota archaeon]|nr:hypothetical protein [Candidatus Bathyarchaeota archaeon]
MTEKLKEDVFDELVQMRVSKALVEKCRAKMKLSPKIPDVYVVDQALRNYVEEKK